MPIYAERNLYPGVNAHLNSYLQVSREGMWESFHFRFISQLADILDETLPAGYDVLAEKSLQIGEYQQNMLEALRRTWTKSDVMIYRTGNESAASGTMQQTQSPTLILPFDPQWEVEDEDALTSIIIFREDNGQSHPVTRIELLSPANKPGGSHYEKYLARRRDVLRSGLRLVEIDFLHHTLPMNTALPIYRHQEAHSAPYVILVSQPRSSLAEVETAAYQIGVLDVLPRITLPLQGKDKVEVDFADVYTGAFDLRRFKARVDYATDPPAFDRFTPEDQAALSAFLADIRAQHTSA
jgi:hypothetical protein